MILSERWVLWAGYSEMRSWKPSRCFVRTFALSLSVSRGLWRRRFERSLNVGKSAEKLPERKPEKPVGVRPLPEMAERLVALEKRVDSLEVKTDRPR